MQLQARFYCIVPHCNCAFASKPDLTWRPIVMPNISVICHWPNHNHPPPILSYLQEGCNVDYPANLLSCERGDKCREAPLFGKVREFTIDRKWSGNPKGREKIQSREQSFERGMEAMIGREMRNHDEEESETVTLSHLSQWFPSSPAHHLFHLIAYLKTYHFYPFVSVSSQGNVFLTPTLLSLLEMQHLIQFPLFISVHFADPPFLEYQYEQQSIESLLHSLDSNNILF